MPLIAIATTLLLGGLLALAWLADKTGLTLILAAGLMGGGLTLVAVLLRYKGKP